MTAIWCGDPTWIAQNFGFLKMSNFDICVVHLGFGAILGDPKFGPFHVGSPHHMAVTGYTWLTLVINCNNEVCSPSNNTVSKAFWRKKVLSEQKISYCEGIYKEWILKWAVIHRKKRCLHKHWHLYVSIWIKFPYSHTRKSINKLETNTVNNVIKKCFNRFQFISCGFNLLD